MAAFIVTIVVGLIVSPFVWCLSYLILLNEISYIIPLIIYLYLIVLLDDFQQQYYKLLSEKTEIDNSPEESIKTFIYLHTPIQKFLKRHRRKHLSKRKKLQFQPALSSIEEVDEIFYQTENEAQHLEKVNSPNPASKTLISQSVKETKLTSHLHLAATSNSDPSTREINKTFVEPTYNKPSIPSPKTISSTSFGKIFSKKSLIIPDFIVPSENILSNFNHSFAEQYNQFLENRKHKYLPFFKRKLKSIKKKLFKK
ncbi:hypothetical protein NPIL_686421 [Nephila pilipes]|uniref:Transmembrane protein n=1 Tax=Nephila pilipes TaxID=299642 RepID=A0A8X6T6U7_NEPPI|nr:hypothetical protein NPIL_686421 [Nephila pilipes]